MATWQKINITTETGEIVEASAPLIISASRSTDIPAFYIDWFIDRIKKGYSVWTNPFNGAKSYISYDKCRFIVFWSKNPRNLLRDDVVQFLKERNIKCYIQYTINDYEDCGLEKNVPSLDERIETFKALTKVYGEGSVIWRFDPLMLTDKTDIESLISRIESIGDSLKGYTEKLVFSFADLITKVKRNLDNVGISYQEWTPELMKEFGKRLSMLNQEKKWGYVLATCGEKIDLSEYEIEHNHCVDDTLMCKIAYEDEVLMDVLGFEIRQKQNSLFGDDTDDDSSSNIISLSDTLEAVRTKNNKDNGQRLFCGCMKSKDIGEYNTCIHGCEYCYANTSKETARANYERYLADKDCESIIG